MIYWQLFISFLQVGLFSIGGGYAAIPVIQSLAVHRYGWLKMKEFTDLITIAEMTPGPIAINAATFVGIRMAGFTGSLIAIAGCLLPSLIIVSIMSAAYLRYRHAGGFQRVLSCLRPAVVALIAAAALSILSLAAFHGENVLVSNVDWLEIGLFGMALFILRRKKWNPVYVMICCGVLKLLLQIAGGGLLL